MKTTSRSILTHVPVLHWFTPVRIAVLFTALTWSVCAQETAPETDDAPKPVTLRATETDVVTISADGTIQLSFARAPTGATAATLNAVNTDGYVHWSGPLRKSGTGWRGQLDQPAIEALLISSALRADFPEAASNGRDLRISYPRDRYTDAMVPVAALLGSAALFYSAPPPPDPADELETDADVNRVNSFAVGSLRYDEQLRAYHHRLVAAQASAISMWTDLKTARRLPDWPDSVYQAQEQAYAKLLGKASDAKRRQASFRREARAAVAAWNSAHPTESRVTINFTEEEDA